MSETKVEQKLASERADDFVRTSEELHETVKELAEARRRVARLSQELDNVRHERNLATEELHNMRVSVFWRATSPARKLFTRFPGLAGFLRRFARAIYRTATGKIFGDIRRRALTSGTQDASPTQREIKAEGVADRLSSESAARLLRDSQCPPSNAAIVSAKEYSPKISLIVPTYNTPSRYLYELIDSVHAQSYDNWQLCFADDGSSDESTKEIIRKAAAGDERIRVALCEENRGIGTASMEAVKLADGEYISMLDHDDVLAPGALSAVVAEIRKHRDVDMFYTDHAMMSKTGELLSVALKPDWSPEFFLNTNYVVHFKTVRKELFDKIEGFTGTHDLYTDGGLILKLMRAGAKIQHIPQVQYYWRMHERSVSDSSARKPGIIRAATDSVDKFLGWKGVSAHSVWATKLQQTGFGIYKLEFPERPIEKIAVVVIAWPGSSFEESFCETFERTVSGQTNIYFVGIGGQPPRPQKQYASSTVVRSQDEFDLFLQGIDAEAIVFVPTGALFPVCDWLAELTGYLNVSPDIGAVGGKVLDSSLKTDSGGIRLLPGLPTMSRGKVDTDHGYWFENTIANDVEAVSLRLMATRMNTIKEIGGPPVFEYDEGASIAYCLKLKEKGLRVVFNPWSKIVVSSEARPLKGVEQKLISKFGQLHDRYYHPQFDLHNA